MAGFFGTIFSTPAFAIAGLLLAAIPIIIHILNRRRFKTVTWAAMEYLLRAMRKNRRRLKFEQILLLATRCALLALLGLALARPLMCNNRAAMAIGTRQTGLTVFVIDNSYSMGFTADHGGGAKTHFEQAKRLTQALIDRLTAGSESVAVVTSARTSRGTSDTPANEKNALLALNPGYDLEAAKDAVGRLELTSLDTDLPGALQLALRLAREDTRQSEKKLFIITDATRSAWETPQAQALKELGPDLAKVFRVTNCNLTQGRQQSNLAVLDIRPMSNLVTTKSGSDFAAKVLGYGNTGETPLRWTLNDVPLRDTPAKKYDTDMDATGVILARPPLPSGGPQILSVSVLNRDNLQLDDTRFRVVDVAADVKTLIVEGQRGATEAEGSGFFLRAALAPASDEPGPGGKGTNSALSVDLVSDIELAGKALDEYRAVVLAGVAQIQPAQADALKNFVQLGGTLMLFMGEPVEAENYNSVLLPRKLLPGPLVKRMTTAATNEKAFTFEFSPSKPVHPYLKEFKETTNNGLDTAQITTYWQVDVPANAKVDRVLNYLPRGGSNNPSTGPVAKQTLDPAITVHELGQGRVVFVSTTANSDWTTLPAKPNYVTLMQELVQNSARTGDFWMNLKVGQPLEVPATIKLIGAPALVDPLKQQVLIDPVTGADGQTIYRSRPLNRPGVYTLSTGNRAIPIAVNIPITEADIRTVDHSAMKKALGGIDINERGDEMPTDTIGSDSGNDVSRAIMIAVFALLAVECFMAMWFGHYRRRDVQDTRGAEPATV